MMIRVLMIISDTLALGTLASSESSLQIHQPNHLRYPRWFGTRRFVCPLPKELPSYYNIMTPLSPLVWGAVLMVLASTVLGFLIISLVYGSLPVIANEWKW